MSSRTGRRLIEALSFVAEKESTDHYSEHLKHLADVDDQELHSKYMVLRFVIAVTPILGFLGTVVHFGGAIGSFSFDDMDAKLPVIVGGMGTAFNTTSVALATAMTMMFAMFLCERVDQSIVASIDRLIDRELLNRFESKHAEMNPFVSVIQMANKEALQSITQTMVLHTQAWTRGLDTLFEHFRTRQQQDLNRQQETFELLRQRQEAWEATREQQYRQMLDQMESRQAGQTQQIQILLERAIEFRQDISELVQTLNAIAKGEGRLVELQGTLSDNLRVLHESSELDTAMQGLTAAIHLMTTKNRRNEISDSAAA